MQAGLAENRRGWVEQRPAAGLGAATDEDGEAWGQFAGGVGVGGAGEDAAASRGVDVDAVFAGARLILQQHAVAVVERDAVDRRRACESDTLDRGHSNRLFHGATRPRQRVGGGIAGPRGERDAPRAAGRENAAKCDRWCVEVDVAVGGRDFTRDRQCAGRDKADVVRRADGTSDDGHVAGGLEGDRTAAGGNGVNLQGILLVDGDRVAVRDRRGIDAGVKPQVGDVRPQVDVATAGLAQRHGDRRARDQSCGDARGGGTGGEIELVLRADRPQEVVLRARAHLTEKADVGPVGRHRQVGSGTARSHE